MKTCMKASTRRYIIAWHQACGNSLQQVNCRESMIDEKRAVPIGKSDDVARTSRGTTATPTTAVNLLGLNHQLDLNFKSVSWRHCRRPGTVFSTKEASVARGRLM